MLAAGWWTKARCLFDGGWEGGEEFLGWCYTDVYPLFFAEGLDRGLIPYLDTPVEYPVLTGAQMWAAAQVSGGSGLTFFHVTAGWGAVLLLATLALLARGGVPARRLWWFAAAPTTAVYAAMNWEPLPVFLLVAAIVAHRRDRDVVAGVAAGLGAAAKLFPAVVVPLVFATRWAQHRRRDALAHAAAAAGSWALVNLPVALAAPAGWSRFVRLNRDRVADWDSLWFALEQLRGGLRFDTAALNLASALLFAAGAVAILLVGRRRWPVAEWWRLSLPLLAWFLLANKVYSPQFSLWLLPLLVWVLPRTGPLLAFLITDLGVFLVRFPFLAGQIGLPEAPPYPVLAVAVLLRAAVLVWIVAEVSGPAPGATAAELPRSGTPGAHPHAAGDPDVAGSQKRGSAPAWGRRGPEVAGGGPGTGTPRGVRRRLGAGRGPACRARPMITGLQSVIK